MSIFDGTLAYYEPGQGIDDIGEPIEPMVRRVKKWLNRGDEVRIFTARADKPGQVKLVEKWTEKIFGERLPVTNVKDHDMIELWDDRAVEVVTNLGIPMFPEWDEEEDEDEAMNDSWDEGYEERMRNFYDRWDRDMEGV